MLPARGTRKPSTLWGCVSPGLLLRRLLITLEWLTTWHWLVRSIYQGRFGILDIQLAQGSETNSYLLLGRCYLRGLGVPANRDYAERLWQHAVIDWEDPEAREELEDAGMDVPSTVVDYFG